MEYIDYLVLVNMLEMYSCILKRIHRPEDAQNDPCTNLRRGPGPPKQIIHMIFPSPKLHIYPLWEISGAGGCPFFFFTRTLAKTKTL